MALLTAQQQQDLWDNRFESLKCYNDDTQKDASTFHCFRFASNLDGHNYYVTLETGVTHSSTATTCETKTKEQLALMEYIEPVGHSTIEI